MFCLFLIQESTRNLTQEIHIDSCVKGACKSTLALVPDEKFPNDDSDFSVSAPGFCKPREICEDLAHVELSTWAALPEKDAATPGVGLWAK